ncbi:DUF2262 domain-containing protein [Lacinutrix sp. 5H-3-7-4]|uniref:DUF2262 domain-containing protein n=1 Tax=Lacinutrix sp. (strain 5H-3-7-4) TaxID=983544 RepID=UPI00020A3C32|nr:DUF2262 domain-containing protein [Lacinutrix sp. 5H-3-7-4]AEH01958.1 hypothetical protein Lacal_2112 [Lacinutrix sp. 5H-3-7-4]
MKITKNNLEKEPKLEGSYKIKLTFNDDTVVFRLSPDGASLSDILALANNVANNFNDYKQSATDAIVEDYFDNYNDNWADEDEGYPQLTKEAFISKLTITAINFTSTDLIDVFFNEDGMFGYHTLIAQSYDGETFKDTTMFG